MASDINGIIRHQLLNECDLLQGNINRMMVTDDNSEIYKMFVYAHKHLDTIFWENYRRINRKEKGVYHEQENN